MSFLYWTTLKSGIPLTTLKPDIYLHACDWSSNQTRRVGLARYSVPDRRSETAFPGARPIVLPFIISSLKHCTGRPREVAHQQLMLIKTHTGRGIHTRCMGIKTLYKTPGRSEYYRPAGLISSTYKCSRNTQGSSLKLLPTLICLPHFCFTSLNTFVEYVLRFELLNNANWRLLMMVGSISKFAVLWEAYYQNQSQLIQNFAVNMLSFYDVY